MSRSLSDPDENRDCIEVTGFEIDNFFFNSSIHQQFSIFNFQFSIKTHNHAFILATYYMLLKNIKMIIPKMRFDAYIKIFNNFIFNGF